MTHEEIRKQFLNELRNMNGKWFIDFGDWFRDLCGNESSSGIVRKSITLTEQNDRRRMNKQAKRKAKNRAAKQARRKNRK